MLRMKCGRIHAQSTPARRPSQIAWVGKAVSMKVVAEELVTPSKPTGVFE